MTNAPTIQSAPATSVPNVPGSEVGPDFVNQSRTSEGQSPEGSSVVDLSGRPLGARAVKTRLRILDATTALLDEKSMRDLRVIDIARRIGASPATFYQYFKDVEDVVLELIRRLNEKGPEFHDLIRGDWRGRDGHARGREFASRLIRFWGDHSSLLRARNNAADDGNEAFIAARSASQAPIVKLFSEMTRQAHPVRERSEDGEWTGGNLYPVASAHVLLSSIEGLIVRRQSVESQVEDHVEGDEEIIETLATLFQLILT